MAEKQKIMKSAMENTNKATAQLIKTTNGAVVSEEALAAAQEQSTLSAQAAQLGWKALSVAGNMLVMYAVSQLIRGFYELSQVSETVAKKAKEIGNSFSSAKSDIEGYKDQIRELYQTINDSGSSLEEVTNARKNLMSIQDELIDKFGTERETIESITEAIYGETDALDGLTERQWQASKNEFNNGGFWNSVSNFFNGYSDNIDRMEKEYANYTAKFDLSLFNGFLNQNSGHYEEFKKLLQDDFDVKISMDDYGTEFAEISGNATKVYETLLDIQNLSDEFDFGNGFNNYLTQLANSAKDTSDKYADFYNQHILEDKIFKDDDYTSPFNQIRNAYKEYQNASISGDEAAIEKATENFSNILAQATDGITDESVLDFFNNMYPAMQVIVDKWEFKAKILPEFNTEALEGKTQNDILAMLQTNGEEDAEKIFNEIVAKAKECDLITDDNAEGIQKVLDLLVEWGILQGEITSDAQSIESPTFDPSSFSKTIKSLSSLQNLYNDFYNDVHKDKVDFTFDIGDIEALREDFGGVCDSFDEFERLATSSSTTADQLQNTFDKLSTEYIFNSGALDHLTIDNREMIASQLQLQGIMGVSSLLTEDFARACEDAGNKGIDFANATYEEIDAFITKGEYAEDTVQKLYAYAIQKKLANENCLSTVGDIAALEALCTNLGIATDSLGIFAKAKSLQARIDSGTGSQEANSRKQLEYAKNRIKELASQISTTSGTYTNMGQSAANAAKATDSSSKSAEKETDIMSELNSEMDEYQSKLQAIKEARETYNEHGKISIDQAQEILDADFKLFLVASQIRLAEQIKDRQNHPEDMVII